MQEYGIYFNIATFLTVVGGIIRLMYVVAREQTQLRIEREAGDKENADRIREADNKADKVDRAAAERTEMLRREAGEMGTSLRTKIQEVELWLRDNFVRKDSFEIVVGRIERSLDKIDGKIDDRFSKLEQKIERHPANGED